MPYPPTGPFSPGVAPGISATFLNNVEAWLATALQADGDVTATSLTVTTLTVNTSFSGPIACTRNGAASFITAWFTGTGTPSSPPNAAVWIKA